MLRGVELQKAVASRTRGDHGALHNVRGKFQMQVISGPRIFERIQGFTKVCTAFDEVYQNGSVNELLVHAS